jgi:hypothetical protein
MTSLILKSEGAAAEVELMVARLAAFLDAAVIFKVIKDSYY